MQIGDQVVIRYYKKCTICLLVPAATVLLQEQDTKAHLLLYGEHVWQCTCTEELLYFFWNKFPYCTLLYSSILPYWCIYCIYKNIKNIYIIKIFFPVAFCIVSFSVLDDYLTSSLFHCYDPWSLSSDRQSHTLCFPQSLPDFPELKMEQKHDWSDKPPCLISQSEVRAPLAFRLSTRRR